MKFYPEANELALSITHLPEYTLAVIVGGQDSNEYKGQVVIRIGDIGLMPAVNDYFYDVKKLDIQVRLVKQGTKFILEA